LIKSNKSSGGKLTNFFRGWTMTDIFGVKLGAGKAFLLRGKDGCVLIDTGSAGCEQKLFTLMKKEKIAPSDIKLIVITHVHYDHTGSLAAIQKECRCPVAVHKLEAGYLEKAVIRTPPPSTPMGKFLIYIGRNILSVEQGFTGVKPDILIGGNMRLNGFGIHGVIVPTPGHTAGSLSVILDSGEAFVGDLVMNFVGTVYPQYAESPADVYKSWRYLIGRGVSKVYQAHGPCPVGIRRLVSARKELS
jgi:hydroxyacylglutathione hydrolase